MQLHYSISIKPGAGGGERESGRAGEREGGTLTFAQWTTLLQPKSSP